MWPWSGLTGGALPPTAPGQPFPNSPIYSIPGVKPTLGSMIDYQGKVAPINSLGFDYDTVPYK
jgi:hypothetical protein